MDIEALVAEYRSVGIGPLILGEVRELARSVVRSYDPVVYGRVWRWDEGIDDLVQEFCLEVLIERGQLDYAVLTAADRQHFRRLIARQIRHLLARRRCRTIVDNLLDRSRGLVSAAPFRLLSQRRSWSYTLKGKEPAPGRATDAELDDIAARLAGLPKLGAGKSDRAPIIYSTDSLRTLLELAADTVESAVRVADLDRILSSLLTSWLPGFLQESEGAANRPDTGVVSSEERAIARELSEGMADSCTPVQLEVLRLKLAGGSDREIAKEMGISRPTVAKRRVEVMSMLTEALTGVSDATHALILERLEAVLNSRRE
jgi:RNA polymerase sigma factor (sigma-70 family)